MQFEALKTLGALAVVDEELLEAVGRKYLSCDPKDDPRRQREAGILQSMVTSVSKRRLLLRHHHHDRVHDKHHHCPKVSEQCIKHQTTDWSR